MINNTLCGLELTEEEMAIYREEKSKGSADDDIKKYIEELRLYEKKLATSVDTPLKEYTEDDYHRDLLTFEFKRTDWRIAEMRLKMYEKGYDPYKKENDQIRRSNYIARPASPSETAKRRAEQPTYDLLTIVMCALIGLAISFVIGLVFSIFTGNGAAILIMLIGTAVGAYMGYDLVY